MVLDQDLLALADQAFPRAVVQVQVDAVLFLSQTRLGLLHVLGDRVVANELLRLGLVVRLGRGEERLLERFAVDVEVLSVRIRLVEPERDLVERKGSQPGEASVRALEGKVFKLKSRHAPKESMTFLIRSVSIVSPFLCCSISLSTAFVNLSFCCTCR